MEHPEDLPPNREKFEEKLAAITEKKGINAAYLSEEKYAKVVQEVKEATEKKVGRTKKDRDRIRKYSICTVNGQERLIEPPTGGDIKYYVSNGEMYDALMEAHLAVSHGGKNRMLPILGRKYCNVSQEAVLLFLSLCGICLAKKKPKKRGIVVKPMVFEEMNQRCQVDLIDMQSHPDGAYRFIFVYQDHLTKFVVLRPLERKTAEEVADNLLDVFCIFGAPSVLQSDNGREFCNHLITEMTAKWEEVKIVHGKPRHSQSQGSVERANQDVQDMLTAWMMQNRSTKWSQGLRFIQCAKNRAIHQGTRISPYEAMFGSPMKVGLRSKFPSGAVDELQTEEELQDFLEGMRFGNADSPMTASQDEAAGGASQPPMTPRRGVPLHMLTGSPPVQPTTPAAPVLQSAPRSILKTPSQRQSTSALQNTPVSTPRFVGFPAASQVPVAADDEAVSLFCCNQCGEACSAHEECSECGTGLHPHCARGGKCGNCSRAAAVLELRSTARKNLQKQAQTMQKISDAKFPPASVGDTVTVSVPKVDRGRGDPRNVVAVVLEATEDGFYKLGNKDGVLASMYARNQFDVVKEKFVSTEVVPETEHAFRTAATKGSILGGQGFRKCNCNGKCTTNRCACRKAGELCKSQCHGGRPCCNKG